MNKRHLHHVWRTLRHVRPVYFVVLTIVFGALFLVSARNNNKQMDHYRQAVFAADASGGDVEGALRKLREYIYGHMNTSLASGKDAVYPPIQLQHTYERLQQQQQAVLGDGNSALYQEAQAACEQQTAIGSEVISCIQEYAKSHGANLAEIPDSLYKFDFTAAKWSPDLAGWSMVACLLSIIGFIVTAAYRWWAKTNL